YTSAWAVIAVASKQRKASRRIGTAHSIPGRSETTRRLTGSNMKEGVLRGEPHEVVSTADAVCGIGPGRVHPDHHRKTGRQGNGDREAGGRGAPRARDRCGRPAEGLQPKQHYLQPRQLRV